MKKKKGMLSKRSLRLSGLFVLFTLLSFTAYAVPQQNKEDQNFTLKNNLLTLTVHVNYQGIPVYEEVESNTSWANEYHNRVFDLKDDANFNLNFMWTAWSAPGKINNANNIVNFTKKDFQLTNHQIKQLGSNGKELVLLFKGTNNPLEIRLTYQIKPHSFFIKKRLSVRSPKAKTLDGANFLRKISPVDGKLLSNATIVKKGGFGQPIAWQTGQDNEAGAFMGLEYPTSTNTIVSKPSGTAIKCYQVMGKRIDDQWVSSNWVVEALTPEPQIRMWFMKYVNTIRVKPVKPYLLYNSWYDLEAPQLVHSPDRVMNQKNVLRSIKLLKENLTDKRHVHLNAVVLDDGWDTYRSDWKVSHKQFPHGFKPITRELHKMGSVLGLWFGPIGGYSHRNWRVNWMKSHGYETTGSLSFGDEMDIAGTKYHQLFKKRVDNFASKDHIGYYKWDGIQFSSSNPNNGHLVGIYSRRAVMQSMIDLCRSTRKANPSVFLNVTSGTWLSPWWVKYANTIWMQGGDYGYSNIPSISTRDQAMTYRDFVLYGDFKRDHFWFPISNLMTHGIIKGRLQRLGEVKEPIDKFANNALMYFSRGVAMWELYISPDMLTQKQWNVLAGGVKWAKANFDQLRHTVMVGGDPGKGATYGYAHFSGNKGVIVVRNPVMKSQKISIDLKHSLGLQNNAHALVIERVYPDRFIEPNLYASNDKLNITLSGYETAIYQVYPLSSVHRPLLAGAVFESKKSGNNYDFSILNVKANDGGAHILNPNVVNQVNYMGRQMNASQLSVPTSQPLTSISDISVQKINNGGNSNDMVMQANFSMPDQISDASFAMLLKSNKSGMKSLPKVTIMVNGKQEKVNVVKQKGNWGWFKVPVRSGNNKLRIEITKSNGNGAWEGVAHLWVRYLQKANIQHLTVQTSSSDQSQNFVLPPHTIPNGYLRKHHKLGVIKIH
ncbi:MAG TPA: alpha-galactosidase [Balneolales bacterium]|nr:alpha-galactosidase [Balneolales bacterium]